MQAKTVLGDAKLGRDPVDRPPEFTSDRLRSRNYLRRGRRREPGHLRSGARLQKRRPFNASGPLQAGGPMRLEPTQNADVGRMVEAAASLHPLEKFAVVGAEGRDTRPAAVGGRPIHVGKDQEGTRAVIIHAR